MHGPEAVSDKREKKYRMMEYRRETRKEFVVGWKSTRNNASNMPPGERPTNAPNPIIADQPFGKNHFEPLLNRNTLWVLSRHFRMSGIFALPPKEDIVQQGGNVRFVP
jgi:hypothetical protein